MLHLFLNKSSRLKVEKKIEVIFKKYYMMLQGTNLYLYLSGNLNCSFTDGLYRSSIPLQGKVRVLLLDSKPNVELYF